MGGHQPDGRKELVRIFFEFRPGLDFPTTITSTSDTTYAEKEIIMADVKTLIKDLEDGRTDRAKSDKLLNNGPAAILGIFTGGFSDSAARVYKPPTDPQRKEAYDTGYTEQDKKKQ